MIIIPLAVLADETKLVLMAIAIAGPIMITTLLLIIKRIEKNNPDKIRWR